jgi:hypothetical protein
MRWNCPHCWSGLAMADEKMPDGWAFSSCYKCTGFALVRRGARNIIKVDSAPAGENVLIATARIESEVSAPAPSDKSELSSPTPPTLEAAPSPVQDSKIRPQIKSVVRRLISAATAPIAEAKSTPPPSIVEEATKNQMAEQSETLKSRFVAVAEVAADIKRGVMPQVLTSSDTSLASSHPFFPQPLPEPPIATQRSRPLPFLIGLTAALAVGSAAFLYVKGQTIFTHSRHAVTHAANIDAPPPRHIEAEVDVPKPHIEAERAAFIPPSAQQAVAVTTQPTVGTTLARNQKEQVDQVRQQAMAPTRAPSAAGLIVRPKTRGVSLRLGPGNVFGVVGTADDSIRYVVTDWTDRWFKISAENEGESSAKTAAGWIRTDAVQVVATEQ